MTAEVVPFPVRPAPCAVCGAAAAYEMGVRAPGASPVFARVCPGHARFPEGRERITLVCLPTPTVETP